MKHRSKKILIEIKYAASKPPAPRFIGSVVLRTPEAVTAAYAPVKPRGKYAKKLSAR